MRCEWNRAVALLVLCAVLNAAPFDSPAVEGAVADPVAATAGTGEETPLFASRYAYLLDRIAEGSREERLVFAQAALDALIEAFEREVDAAYAMAREDAATAPGLRAWARGAEGFVARLDGRRRALAARPEVAVIRSRGRDVRLVIGAEQIMVSAPRPNEQLALEEAIAGRLCRHYNCETQPETLADRTRRKASSLRESWEFGDRVPPTYSASDGLHCVYRDRTHLALKKRVCEAVLYELRLVAESLLALRQRGAQVDFEGLVLKTQRGTQVLEYDGRYRSFTLRLPVLAQAPDLLKLSRRWLKATSEGRTVNHFLTIPDEVVYDTGERLARGSS